jgi:hypothetical protein
VESLTLDAEVCDDEEEVHVPLDGISACGVIVMASAVGHILTQQLLMFDIRLPIVTDTLEDICESAFFHTFNTL